MLVADIFLESTLDSGDLMKCVVYGQSFIVLVYQSVVCLLLSEQLVKLANVLIL